VARYQGADDRSRSDRVLSALGRYSLYERMLK
jgi:hypothetical protein